MPAVRSVTGLALGLVIMVPALAVSGSAPPSAPLAGPGSAAIPGWRAPLPGTLRVVRAFDPPAQPWLPGHRGVDLAGRPGERVRAAGAGVVGFAGRIAHVGVVSVTSGALRTTYQPLRVAVHEGQRVAAGTTLGRLTLAGSHCPPAACLHWGLLRGSDYLDPMALLGRQQVRLLPLPLTQ